MLSGKKGVIMGLANDRSIAYGIAEELFNNGAKFALTYQGEVLKKRVYPIADKFQSPVFECDVSDEYAVNSSFDSILNEFGKIDFLVHAIAFSDKNELEGKYIDTSKANFLNTMNVSCYSFVKVVKAALSIANEGANFLTLSYYGAEKVVPNYNVMGVAKAALECSVRYMAYDLGSMGMRVNCISAGPIKTLAAAGISGFKDMLKVSADSSPLRQNVDIRDIGKTAVYLLSDLSSGVTGEVVHVDAGYNVMGFFK